MKRVLLATLFFLSINKGFSQVSEKELLKKTEETIAKIQEEKPNGWEKKGVATVLLNQASFNNWLAGGQSSISGNTGIKYDLNYKSDTWTWDNKLNANYGLTKINGQDLRKTDDRFEFNSLLGKKASGEWYYSFFFNFKTQFDSGFDPANNTIKISHFLSPSYTQFGPGMMWKKNDNLKINVAPATSKIIMVHKHFTELGPAFGVRMGESSRYEFGAAVNAYYKFNIMENVSAENIFNSYTNYLEDVYNVDIDYTLNIVMKVNKYLTTNFAFQTIYDDNAYRGFQTRQVIGIGVNYGF
ncbi:DUF3078 domain-containing protein [Flavobacterium sp. J49]|uniref:DUF3078 domain-containing protein n=1 Tax=Flavobacterium sp. J49 TaxID=2718534 RepID=UPI0015934846|nr:DUF3078 domain-containing protein [Flavobacterium sp. J49]MBF6641401.1 DUF3078 domain-containing protein [Flavobacterium sp. J49]NIC02648.1 DUF3078 domain-containing protein [Flavobacterium sp. J49]